jgi:hypothetical protein
MLIHLARFSDVEPAWVIPIFGTYEALQRQMVLRKRHFVSTRPVTPWVFAAAREEDLMDMDEWTSVRLKSWA